MAGLSTVANPADGLRLELKAWEAEFAASHNGKKPNREDIKQDPNISRPALRKGIRLRK